jgi:NAD(P)-dependent dehydrogenase (short-subunit alcohol dehydrogenase family)
MTKPVMLVTGGSRGIGEAICRAGARAGFAIALNYVSRPDVAESVVRAIEGEGGVARAIRGDMASPADVAELFAAADSLGPLAAMVYSAGITGPALPLVEADPVDIASVVDVNLSGALYCAREAIARMSRGRGGDGGSIVFISSRATAYGSPGEYVWYAASKSGLDTLTMGLAREVGRDGIRVNAVSPGPIDTGMLIEAKREKIASLVALQRVGQPEEVADAVMFLVSEKASYVTGANLAVAGGR